MGICLAWPSSELLNGFSGKALSGSAPIHKLWCCIWLAGFIVSMHVWVQVCAMGVVCACVREL